MALSRFWRMNRNKRTVPTQNIKVNDETIKQIENLINIYSVVQQTLGTDYFDSPRGVEMFECTISSLKETLKILKQNKQIEKDKEETRTEFDVWFNSRK